MVEKVNSKNSIESSPAFPLPPPSHQPPLIPSCVESLEPPRNHCIAYFQNLLVTLSEVLWRIYELLKVILCCAIEEKDSMSFTPIEQNINVPDEDRVYAALELSLIDQENIFFIFNKMAGSMVDFGFNVLEVQRRGSRIEHVHPFKLMEYFFRTSLKADLLTIRKERQSFWNTTVGNIEKGFNSIPTVDLLKLLPGFAHSLELSPDALTIFIQDKNWKGLLNFLLDTLN